LDALKQLAVEAMKSGAHERLEKDRAQGAKLNLLRIMTIESRDAFNRLTDSIPFIYSI
jgi:hypothetical protein